MFQILPSWQQHYNQPNTHKHWRIHKVLVSLSSAVWIQDDVAERAFCHFHCGLCVCVCVCACWSWHQPILYCSFLFACLIGYHPLAFIYYSNQHSSTTQFLCALAYICLSLHTASSFTYLRVWRFLFIMILSFAVLCAKNLAKKDFFREYLFFYYAHFSHMSLALWLLVYMMRWCVSVSCFAIPNTENHSALMLLSSRDQPTCSLSSLRDNSVFKYQILQCITNSRRQSTSPSLEKQKGVQAHRQKNVKAHPK